jgi:hypothetical protein
VELTLLVLQKTHHNQSRGRPTHDISLKVVADPRTLYLLKVVADPRTLYLTQSRGRPMQLIFHSKLWQIYTLYLTQSRGRPMQLIFHSKLWQTCALHIPLKVVVDPYNSYFTQSRGRPMHHTSPFKVVVDLRTQVHGILRTNKIAISSINSRCQTRMADTRGNCVFGRLEKKHSRRPELFISKAAKDLRGLTTC